MYRLRTSALQQFTKLPERSHAAGGSPEKV